MNFEALTRHFDREEEGIRLDPKVRYHKVDDGIKVFNFCLYVLIPIGLAVGRWLGRMVAWFTILFDILGTGGAVVLYLFRICQDRNSLRATKKRHQTLSVASAVLSVAALILMFINDVDGNWGSKHAVLIHNWMKAESQLAKNLTFHIRYQEGLNFTHDLENNLTSSKDDQLSEDDQKGLDLARELKNFLTSPFKNYIYGLLDKHIYKETIIDEKLTKYRNYENESNLTKELENYINTNGTKISDLSTKLNEYLDSKERIDLVEELIRYINENEGTTFDRKMVVNTFSLSQSIIAMVLNILLVEKLAKQDALQEEFRNLPANQNIQALRGLCPNCRVFLPENSNFCFNCGVRL